MSIKGFNINGQVQKYDYNALDNIPPSSGGGGITNEVKEALLQLAQKVAYSDAHGEDYYQDLYDALYATPQAQLVSISAVYTQSGTVYDSASLDSLRSDLVVTGHYDDSSTQTVTGYTLSGTLTAGTSVITVSYQSKTTTFNVTVTATPTLYSVTNTLTECTNSNDATSVYQGSSYSGTLSPIHSGYLITTVSITMGGTDVTGTAYANGTISIPNVTGNIVITAVATERQATLSSIDAVFSQGANVIYDTDTLDYLKQYLVVTASWSDSTTSTVMPADYVLSGTMVVGTSTITVSYGGKTDTFTVTVTSGVSTVTVSWSGTGSDKTADPILDARNYDVYFTIPFVSGASQLSGTAEDGGNAVAFRSRLYNDAEKTDFVGNYNIDTGTISTASWTWSIAPNLKFGVETLVAPHGYYAVLQCSNNRSAFTSNANCTGYLNNNATDVKLAISR